MHQQGQSEMMAKVSHGDAKPITTAVSKAPQDHLSAGAVITQQH